MRYSSGVILILSLEGKLLVLGLELRLLISGLDAGLLSPCCENTFPIDDRYETEA